MRRMEWTGLLAALALATVTACGGAADDDADDVDMDTTAAVTPAPATPPAAAPAGEAGVGQQIFTQTGNCYTCHGADAKGTPVAPNLTDAEWINLPNPPTVDDIMNLVRTGVPTPKQFPAAMPPMGGAQLNDEQIRAVATYVHSLTQGG